MLRSNPDSTEAAEIKDFIVFIQCGTMRTTLELIEDLYFDTSDNNLRASLQNSAEKLWGKMIELDQQIKILGGRYPDPALHPMQNWLEEKGELEGCITSAIQRLDQAFPFPEHENRDWMKYLPHAKAALELRGHSADKRVQARPDAVRRALRLYRKERSTDRAEAGLFANVAESHYMLGKYQAAEQMYRKALELQKAALGKDHPDTLTSMNNLANVLNSLGKYKMAEKMHRQILKLRKAVLGKDYPDTLISINNLANVLDSRGKYEEAEQIYRQTLELQKAVLGKDHPDTLTRMNNLAIVLRRLGTYGEAGQMHRHTLKLREPGAR